MNIAFSANDAYASHLGIALLSILDNNLNEHAISFYVLTADISVDHQRMLSSLVALYPNTAISFVVVDSHMFEDVPLNIKHITKESYFRFVIADVLPNLNKILYLDVDILVLADLGELYEINIDDYFIAGSHKDYFTKEYPGYKTTIGLQEDDIYINSGVMLLNLDKIRQYDKVKELFENTKKLKNIIRIQDQDIINITFNKVIKNFSDVYNYTESDRRNNKRDSEAIVIVHFNTGNKPWNIDFQLTDTNAYFVNKYRQYSQRFLQIITNDGFKNA